MINTKKLFLFAIMFSFLFSQGKDLNSAKVYIKDKDWKQAELFLLKAVEHPKDKWEAAFHLGDKVYVRSQDWDKVKQYLDLAGTAPESLKIRPTRNDNRIPMQTAITASLTKSFNIIYFKAAGYISLINRTANIEQQNAFIDQAINASNQAKNLDPTQPGAYALLAVYYSLKKDKENTIKYADASLALPDTEEDILLQLLVNAGDCSVRVDELDRASNYLERALLIDSNDISVLKSIATVYVGRNELDKALNIFTRTLEQTEDNQEKADLHFNLGTVYLKKGNPGEAQYHFEETAYLVPDDTEAIFRLARTLEESQRWRSALSYYKDLIDMDPNNPDYYRGAYRASFNDGDPITANEYLQQAKQLEN
ncbi:MAG: tetratricopeptide repeat protein [Candidatus Neomarinimicrobiota bacterium]|nr:tetratricopeptide repeat protein [Candidatus Neomarinimicrobiota bacterium]